MSLLDAAMFAALSERLDELLYEHAEVKRKLDNVVRTGVVKSFDPKTNTIVADVGFETHDIPYFNHGGEGSNWHPPKKGQQVTLLSASGDLTNAVAIPGGFHDKNPQPSQTKDEDIAAQRGAGKSRLRTTDEAAFLEAFKSAVKVADGKVTITADTIVLEGAVKLGGEDASKPAAMQGTTDTGGFANVANLSTKVLVK